MNITGSLSLIFPETTALYLHKLLCGDDCFQINRNVQDSIGELANIVAGGAKTLFSSEGIECYIGLPPIIIGKHQISHKSEIPVVAVPFRLENRKLVMEISIIS